MDASTLQFTNISPVPITDLLDPKMILLKDEQRKAFGYLPMTDEEKTLFEEEQLILKPNATNNSSPSN